MAKAAEDAARAIDGGEGAYHCGSVAEVMAIRRLRDELAAKAAIEPERLRPSAAAAITLVPTAIPAFTDGFLIAVDESLAPLPPGAARKGQKNRDRLHFSSAGAGLALVFRDAHG